MKNKKIFLILVLAFVLLIGGASVLYSRLGGLAEQDQFQIQTKPTEESAVGTESQTQPEETAAPAETTAATEPQAPPAPDFTVYDADGNEVRLSDFVGKPVVLNFWASWCGPCQGEMPDFQQMYQQYGDEIQFMMVNLTDGSRETVSSASAFVKNKGYTFPVFYDTDLDAATVYGVYSIPITILIDAQGSYVAHAAGAVTADALQMGIDMLKGN
jgi:thiol-disulfide isomerase/thioredoxin